MTHAPESGAAMQERMSLPDCIVVGRERMSSGDMAGWFAWYGDTVYRSDDASDASDAEYDWLMTCTHAYWVWCDAQNETVLMSEDEFRRWIQDAYAALDADRAGAEGER